MSILKRKECCTDPQSKDIGKFQKCKRTGYNMQAGQLNVVSFGVWISAFNLVNMMVGKQMAADVRLTMRMYSIAVLLLTFPRNGFITIVYLKDTMNKKLV